MAAQTFSIATSTLMQRIDDRPDVKWQARITGQWPLRPWLQERGSLTACLKKQYPDFAVKVLMQGWRKPHADEQPLLQLPAYGLALVREVMLMGQGQSQVFAHSVIARAHLRGPWNGLRKIGRMPLGAALFANARVRRGRLHYRKLSPGHPLHRACCQHAGLHLRGALWARRSLFSLGPYRLLVTEVFLPSCGRVASA